MANPLQARPGKELQDRNRLWWETSPMSYDWHRTLAAAEDTPEFFREIDRRFFSSSSFYRGNPPFGRLIPFNRLKGKRVLEIGCGLGAHAQLLAGAGCYLTCIDLTQRAVAATRKRLSLQGLPGDVQRMDAEEMAFPDGEFDFVWSWGVIHHSANPERIVHQVYRVLKPTGEFRVMVYHKRSLIGLYCLTRGLLTGKSFQGMSVAEVLNFYSDGYLARFYTQAELAQMLIRCGFSDVETRVLGQKSELLLLSGKGFTGSLKSVLLAGVPDGLTERILSSVGQFAFAKATRQRA